MIKHVGLYLYTLIISHKSLLMLSLPNLLIFHQKLQKFLTKNEVLDKKVKTHKKPLRSQELNQGPLTPKANA